jgi:hypothetical protein
MPLKINHYPKGLEVLRIYDPQKKNHPTMFTLR